MTTAFTESDALGFYQTGAAHDGASKPNADDSLGGFRAGTAVQPLQALISDAIPPVVIEMVTGANLDGLGFIAGQDVSRAQGIEDAITMPLEDKVKVFHADTVAWHPPPPNGAEGTALAMDDGDSVLLEDANDPAKAIRVTRDGFTSMNGRMSLELLKDHRNVLGMGRVTDAQRQTGEDFYRAVMIRAHGSQAVTFVRVWLEPFSSFRLSDTDQLPAAGVGTIGTSATFAGWPPFGAAQILTNAAVLRENVYYSSRTDSVLTISDAAHRGILGTAAAAGAADDLVLPISMCRIGYETPGAGGDIQTIADELTAPAAITFVTPSFRLAATTISTIASGANHGLWIHREIPPDAFVASELEIRLHVLFTVNGTEYDEIFYGLYRIEDTVNNAYELYLGEDEAPDLSASPDGTSDLLPFNFVLTPGASDVEFFATLLFRNEYSVVSLNQYSRKQIIDSSGDPVVATPTAPESIEITNSAGGEVDVVAVYQAKQDTPLGGEADFFRIYHRGDGADPVVGVDTPVDIAMVGDAFFGLPIFRLDSEIGPNPVGTKLHTLVRTLRSSDGEESNNTTIDVTTITTSTSTPTRPKLFLGPTAGQALEAPTVSVTTVHDAGNNIRSIQTNGKTELWAGAVLIWRLIYDGNDNTNNGIWTTFGYTQEQISGTPATSPYETFAWNGQKTIMISVDSGPGPFTRRMKIDVTATQIHFTNIHQVPGDVVLSNSSEPIAGFDWHTLFQVWSDSDLDWQTLASLNTNGQLAIRGGWQQRQTTGEFADV